VHGGAKGADSWAGWWAANRGRHEVIVVAHWSRGKSAGIVRNGVIASLPLAKLIAFPGGRGTADMVAKARAAGIPVVEVGSR
jgi:hypothetical protein